MKTKTETFAESLLVQATESIETITSAEEFKDLEEIIRFLSSEKTKETILNMIQEWKEITRDLEEFQDVLQRQYSNNGQFKKLLFAATLFIGGVNTLSAAFADASTSKATSVFSTALQTALLVGSGYFASLIWTGDDLKKLQWQLEKDVQTCEEMHKYSIHMQGRFREWPRAKIIKVKNLLNRWRAIKTYCEKMLGATKR